VSPRLNRVIPCRNGRLGRPQSFVSKYENGERQIDVAEFIEILSALGADPAGGVANVLTRLSSKPRAQKSRRG
jgi:hypothetical protein